MLILAGDIGGTSTRLAYFDTAGGKLVPVVEERFPSRDAGSLEEIVGRFAGSAGADGGTGLLRHCRSGPPGTGQNAQPPLECGCRRVGTSPGLAEVLLINDLEANAYGIDLWAG